MTGGETLDATQRKTTLGPLKARSGPVSTGRKELDPPKEANETTVHANLKL